MSSANSEPVAGGVVTFTGPGSGASINPSSVTASIGTTTASASVTANATIGDPYTVAASAAGASPNRNFSLTNTIGAPTITGFTTVDNTVCVGSPIIFTATVGNVSGSYTYTLTNGTSTTTGTSSSTAFSQNLIASGSGNQTFTLTVSDNGQSASANTNVTVNSLPIAGLTNNGPLTCANTSITLTASGGTSYTFTAPGGSVLTGSGNTRTVSSPGAYSVTVANASGCVSSTNTTVISNTATVTVTNPATSTATVGVGFSQNFTASGGVAPRSFSLASGSLPTGLSLATSGVLSGTPTQTGSFSLTVRATDANGCVGVGAPYTLVVNEAFSPIRYVKPVASGTGDGSSWANASSNVQSQINLSGTQQVWVAAGVYKPTSTTARTVSFAMKNGVAIYGGFVGSETSLSQRPAINPVSGSPSSSTLSGDIDNSPADNSGNSYHVILNPAGLNTMAVLDGFVITGGNANGSSSNSNAGGMYNNGPCSPSIRNCFFQGNTASSFGGAIYNDSNPVLTNCSFQSNTASSGGAIYNRGVSSDSSPVLTNCFFKDNTASANGGAMFNDGFSGDSNPMLTNCFFQGNTASANGGAIYSDGTFGGNSRPILTNCSFQGNTASDGGAIYNRGVSGNSSPVLTNCSFQDNTASANGGAMFNSGISGNSNPMLTNCSFQGNTASSLGGAIYSDGTFSGNSRPMLTNCVLFGNGGSNTIFNANAFVSATYSLFDNTVTRYNSGGTGNLTTTVTPFVSMTSTQLNGCAPAINAGLNSASGLTGITTDLAGNPRFYNTGLVDMGAYEYQAAPNPSPVLSNPTVSTATVGVGFSQNFTASGGVSPYSYSLASGILPTGLSLSTTGILSGTPTQTGSFTLTVRVTDVNGCVGTGGVYTLTVLDATPTIAGFVASPTAVCVGSPVTFTATVGNVTGSYAYTLTTGSSTTTGTTSNTAFSQNLTAAGSGVQTFTVTVSSSGQTATATTSLTVNDLPTAGLTNNGPLTCAQTSVTLTASGGSSYTFTNGSGVVGTPGTSPTLVVSSPGTYSVTVANASGCVSSTSTTVSNATTVVTATISASPSTTLTCAQTTLTLFSGGGDRYTFSGPGVVNQEGSQALVNIAGVYSVTVTDNATGCFSVTSITISQDASTSVATLSASPSTTLTCAQTSLTLTAGGGNAGETLSYSFSPNVASQSGNKAVVNSSGVYSVTVSNTTTGCFSTTSITISQDNNAPSANLASSGTLSCGVTSVTLTATPNGQSYQFSSGASQIGSSNQATVSAPGLYSVTVINGGNGCTGVASVSVTQDNTAPMVSITANPSLTITQGQSATLIGQGAATYAWSTGANTPAIVVSTAGPYSVTGTSANGCIATASVTLTVQPVVSGPFALTGVSTLDCTPILPNRFSISFNPRYQGLDGSPVSFSVVSELLPTTQPGPYSLQLYTDNPTITLSAVQNGQENRFVYNWLDACRTSTAPNTPPRVVMGIPSQTATVGQPMSYVIPGGTFTDDETPNSLRLSASGVPAGLSFAGSTLSGTPSTTVGSPFSITITATDPGNLSASTVLVLTVQPDGSTPPPPPTSAFSITGVTTISCTPVANRISINFAPRYAGVNGQPIAFQVVNESIPTTDPGPYSLTLYRDNAVITLRASQTGSDGPVSFAYNWLAACSTLGQENTAPRLNEPVASQTAVVGQGYSLNLVNTFIDQETPDQISLSAAGLPAGLSLSGKAITGSVSSTVGSPYSVTLTATDGGGLSTSTSFTITIVPAPVTPPPTATFSLTGVTTVSCEVVSAGQRRVTFTPRYAGLDGSPVSFSVVNELTPTTAPGPYVLNLYTDNAVITLSAVQSGVLSQFSYGWLSACNPGARVSAPVEVPLSVLVLGNPVVGESVSVEVRGAEGQSLRLTLTDERGYLVGERSIEQAGAVEFQTLSLGQSSGGMLLLRVSTPRQSQTLKVIRTH